MKSAEQLLDQELTLELVEIIKKPTNKEKIDQLLEKLQQIEAHLDKRKRMGGL